MFIPQVHASDFEDFEYNDLQIQKITKLFSLDYLNIYKMVDDVSFEHSGNAVRVYKVVRTKRPKKESITLFNSWSNSWFKTKFSKEKKIKNMNKNKDNYKQNFNEKKFTLVL